jgi:hypothetical protein
MPVNVTGECISTFNGSGVWTYSFVCYLKRQGTTVDSELLGDVLVGSSPGVFTAYLSAAKQNNCIYCTRNYGFFKDNHIPENILSTADGDGADKECDTTGGGGGGRPDP